MRDVSAETEVVQCLRCQVYPYDMQPVVELHSDKERTQGRGGLMLEVYNGVLGRGFLRPPAATDVRGRQCGSAYGRG